MHMVRHEDNAAHKPTDTFARFEKFIQGRSYNCLRREEKPALVRATGDIVNDRDFVGQRDRKAAKMFVRFHLSPIICSRGVSRGPPKLTLRLQDREQL